MRQRFIGGNPVRPVVSRLICGAPPSRCRREGLDALGRRGRVVLAHCSSIARLQQTTHSKHVQAALRLGKDLCEISVMGVMSGWG